MNQKVLFLKGLPASGKSTFARDMVKFPNSGWLRVNKDDIRKGIREEQPNISRHDLEKLAIDLEDERIEYYLQSGFNVVVDDTNLNPVHENRIRKIVENYAAGTRNIVEFEVKFFDVPLEECLRRNREREGQAKVPDRVITDMYNKWLRPKRVSAPDYIPGKRNVIIVDLDGTLALFDGNPYDRDFENDVLNEPVAKIIKTLFWDDYDVIITSGRNSKFSEVTKQWLHKNNIDYNHLYMRAEKDNRKDSEVKLDFYNQYIKGQYNVFFVLDDRQQVVDLWRSLGLVCWQVADGNF